MRRISADFEKNQGQKARELPLPAYLTFRRLSLYKKVNKKIEPGSQCSRSR